MVLKYLGEKDVLGWLLLCCKMELILRLSEKFVFKNSFSDMLNCVDIAHVDLPFRIIFMVIVSCVRLSVLGNSSDIRNRTESKNPRFSSVQSDNPCHVYHLRKCQPAVRSILNRVVIFCSSWHSVYIYSNPNLLSENLRHCSCKFPRLTYFSEKL